MRRRRRLFACLRDVGAATAVAAGCAAPTASPPDAAGDPPVVDASPADSPGPCPAAMAHVNQFCIDRYEGALEEQQGSAWVAASPFSTVGSRTVRAVPAAGITPQAYISGGEAASACAASGKRLCSSAEWLAACRGSTSSMFPYGTTHVTGACNDTYDGHPAIDFFGTSTGIWDTAHMNNPGINQQPDTVAAGGAFTQCTTPTGIFDLHGNLHEWVDDPNGTFRGGFYADAKLNGPGCTYATTAHAFGYHDYSTGFRCCADAE